MSLSRKSIRWLVVAVLALLAVSLGAAGGRAANAASIRSGQIALEGGADFVADVPGGLVYASNRTTSSIHVVSLAAGAITATWNMPGEPVGVELSADRTDLFVALYGSGAVVRVDTATGTVEQTYDISSDLGDPRTWELERVGGFLYVSGNPRSNGFAWIVEIDLASGDSRRVASGSIIRSSPELAWDGADALYVAEHSTLYKLDLTADDAPIVLEGHSLIGAQRAAVAIDRIHVGGGQVLDPATFDTIGAIEPGFPAIRPDGTRIYVAQEGRNWTWDHTRIAMFDAATHEHLGTFTTGCNPGDNPYSFEVLPDDGGFLLLGPEELCVLGPLPTQVAPCAGSTPTIIGTPGADDLVGTPGDDVISGLGGRDTIDAGGGNDIVCGGGGADTIVGGAGSDRLFGQGGNDRFTGGEGDDTIVGGRGRDTAVYTDAGTGVVIDLATGLATGAGDDSLRRVENAIGSNYDDAITGTKGKNVLNGAGGDDLVLGMKGADRLIGGPGHDDLRGGAGRDAISGGDGDDFLAGGADADVLDGEGWDDLLVGGPGDDVLRGGSGGDDLAGEAGDDLLTGGRGFDVARYDFAVRGVTASLAAGSATGEGNDTLKSIEGIVGSEFDDILTGNDKFNGIAGLGGDDTLRAGGGSDNIWGGSGNDRLFGYAGDDFLDGEGGTDSLDGGTGDDWCQNGETYAGCEVRTTASERTGAIGGNQHFAATSGYSAGRTRHIDHRWER